MHIGLRYNTKKAVLAIGMIVIMFISTPYLSFAQPDKLTEITSFSVVDLSTLKETRNFNEFKKINGIIYGIRDSDVYNMKTGNKISIKGSLSFTHSNQIMSEIEATEKNEIKLTDKGAVLGNVAVPSVHSQPRKVSTYLYDLNGRLLKTYEGYSALPSINFVMKRTIYSDGIPIKDIEAYQKGKSLIADVYSEYEFKSVLTDATFTITTKGLNEAILFEPENETLEGNFLLDIEFVLGFNNLGTNENPEAISIQYAVRDNSSDKGIKNKKLLVNLETTKAEVQEDNLSIERIAVGDVYFKMSYDYSGQYSKNTLLNSDNIPIMDSSGYFFVTKLNGKTVLAVVDKYDENVVVLDTSGNFVESVPMISKPDACVRGTSGNDYYSANAKGYFLGYNKPFDQNGPDSAYLVDLQKKQMKKLIQVSGKNKSSWHITSNGDLVFLELVKGKLNMHMFNNEGLLLKKATFVGTSLSW